LPPLFAVVRVNVALVAPAGIVTEEGKLTWLIALERLTTKLEVGAELSETVPVDEAPLVTVLGERVKEEIVS
jgi:hypothetical protein